MGLLHHGIDAARAVRRRRLQRADCLYEGEHSVRVMCIAFLSLKLSVSRGISMKMATFILMLQEISVNVDRLSSFIS